MSRYTKKRIIKWFILFVICGLIAVLAIRTLGFHSKQIHLPAIAKDSISNNAVDRLSKAVQIPTISFEDSTLTDTAVFNRFVQYLQTNFPLVASKLQRSLINKYGILYFWQGTDTKLQPIVLTAHYDVVPIEENTRKQWSFEPFSGTISNGYIWGRGTMDDKLGVVGILEAAESLLQKGFTPQRSMYFAFGCNEEVRGRRGAAQLSQYLAKQGIKAEFVLDEGLTITRKLVPNIEPDVALIGLSEKGYLTLRLNLSMAGGHASMPQRETTIEVMARAIARLRDHQPKAQLCLPVINFMQCIGPEMPGINKVFFANTWLFKSFIISAYEKKPSGNSMIRTTISPTQFNSGTKDNVLPGNAMATINIRILPGETINQVLEYCTKTIADERIKISVAPDAYNPSPISSIQSKGYKTIQQAIRELYPQTLVCPSLVNSATDARYYTSISENVYRFSPQITDANDLLRIHGVNERIAIADYENCIRFYTRLIALACK